MRGRREQMQSDARTIGNRFCGTASGPSSSLRIRLGANNSRHGIRPELVSVELNIGRCILPGSPQEKPATGSCRANPSSVAESHAPEIFADEFVMLSRKIQKPPAGNPLFPPSLPPRTASPPPLPPSPAPRVTPAVPVSISVRWSIAILALSPPLAPLLSIPDRLSLCDSSSPPPPHPRATPPFSFSLQPHPLSSRFLLTVSACLCIAIFNTARTREAKVDVRMDHYLHADVLPLRPLALSLFIFGIPGLAIQVHEKKINRKNGRQCGKC